MNDSQQEENPDDIEDLINEMGVIHGVTEEIQRLIESIPPKIAEKTHDAFVIAGSLSGGIELHARSVRIDGQTVIGNDWTSERESAMVFNYPPHLKQISPFRRWLINKISPNTIVTPRLESVKITTFHDSSFKVYDYYSPQEVFERTKEVYGSFAAIHVYYYICINGRPTSTALPDITIHDAFDNFINLLEGSEDHTVDEEDDVHIQTNVVVEFPPVTQFEEMSI